VSSVPNVLNIEDCLPRTLVEEDARQKIEQEYAAIREEISKVERYERHFQDVSKRLEVEIAKTRDASDRAWYKVCRSQCIDELKINKEYKESLENFAEEKAKLIAALEAAQDGTGSLRQGLSDKQELNNKETEFAQEKNLNVQNVQYIFTTVNTVHNVTIACMQQFEDRETMQDNNENVDVNVSALEQTIKEKNATIFALNSTCQKLTNANNLLTTKLAAAVQMLEDQNREVEVSSPASGLNGSVLHGFSPRRNNSSSPLSNSISRVGRRGQNFQFG